MSSSWTVEVSEESLCFRVGSEAERAVLALVEATCLAACTLREVMDPRESSDGCVIVVTPRRPVATFSSGEKALWWLVGELMNGTLREALSRLVTAEEKTALIGAVCALMPHVPARLLDAMTTGAGK